MAKDQKTVLLPVLERELLVLARKKATHHVRSVTALAALLIGAGLWLSMNQHQSASQAGENVFQFLSGLGLVFCLFEGVRLGCDALSKETREGTLGLLFLTDLRSHDIIAGKLGACSLTAFYGMLATLPVLGLSILMGGVTLGEFFRVSLTLIVTLFYSISLCLLISARSREENRSLLFSLLAVFGVNILIPHVIGPYLLMPLDEWITFISPFSTFVTAFDLSYRAEPYSYWGRILVLLGLATICLWWAATGLKKTWMNDRPLAAAAAPRRKLFSWWQPRRPFRDSPNPIFDLASRRQLRLSWWVLFLIVGICLAANVDLDDLTLAIPLSLLAFKICAAWIAAADFQKARQCGALELWLTSPLTVPDIVSGKKRALKRWLWFCLLFVVGSFLVMWVQLVLENIRIPTRIFYTMGGFGKISMHGFGAANRDYDLENLAILAMLVLTFTLDVLAMIWMGMWHGLTSRSISQSVMKTYYTVILLPWLILLLPQIYFMFSGRGFSMENHTHQIVITVVTGILDAWLIFYARNRLFRQFRNVAAETFVRKPSLWERLLARFRKGSGAAQATA